MRPINLRTSQLSFIFIFGFLPQLASAELRCGWVDNPTPANWWLTDRDGEWLLSIQGTGDRGNGFYDIPNEWDFQDQWQETNGSYGYGCGCFEGKVDKTTNWVLDVKALSVKALAVCEGDPALPAR